MQNTHQVLTLLTNITQQNPTLKLVTQFEMNAKHSKRWSDQVVKMSTTRFHTRSSVKNMKATADAGKRRSSFLARVRCKAQFTTVSFCAWHFIKRLNFKFWRTIRYTVRSVMNSCLLWNLTYGSVTLVHLPDSKSIYWQISVVISARTARLPASLMPYHTASVSQFSLQLIWTRKRPTFARKFSDKFSAL